MSSISKLLFSLVMFLMLIFFIWFFIGFTQYGFNMQNVHLDLFESVKHLDLIANNKFINSDYLFYTFRSFRNTMEELYDNGIFNQMLQKTGLIPSDSSYAFGLLTSLIDPILNTCYVIIGGGYIIVLILELLLISFNAIIGIYEFIFSPVFIVDNPIVAQSQAVLEKAKNLFGFAFQGLQLF